MPCSKCGTTAQAIYLLIPRSSFGYLTYCVPCAMEYQRDSMIQLHYWLDKHLTDIEKMGRSKLGK